MENASKALMMAGGVLIAIIIIGLLIMGFNTIRQYPIEQENVRKTQELAKFNAEYEAFNRNHVHGTDVITVINKAIDNNKKYDDYDQIYDIDVKFILKTDVTEYDIIYEPSVDINGDILKNQMVSNIDNRINIRLKAGKPYSVKTNDSDRIDDEINDFFFIKGGNGDNVKIPGIDEWHYTIHMTGFTDFKRRIFKCATVEGNFNTNDDTKNKYGPGVEYNPKTGRIASISFVEKF